MEGPATGQRVRTATTSVTSLNSFRPKDEVFGLWLLFVRAPARLEQCGFSISMAVGLVSVGFIVKRSNPIQPSFLLFSCIYLFNNDDFF